MDTKDAIKETFLLEYAKRDYARINVKGLCAAVPVARTTFYSYYQNTDEVLEDIENDLMAGLNHVADVISEGKLPDMDFNLFLGETMRFVKGRWDDFRALLVLQPDRRFEKKLKNGIKAHFKMRYPGRDRMQNYELITEVMASAVLGGYAYWLEHPEEMREENFKRVITQTLEEFVKILH